MLRLLRGLLILLTCVAGTAHADGDGDGDFRAMVRAATENKLPRIVIPPGTYRLAPDGNGHVVWPLYGVHDIDIVADGVTLISTVLTRAVDLEQCHNVTVEGLTVDYDPLPFTQGTVVAVSPDNRWVDVRVHAGYPFQPYSRIDVVDPVTRIRKRGMPFLWGSKAAISGTDTIRITRDGLGKIAMPGDFISMSTGPDYSKGGIAHAVTINDCSGITFKNVTVHSAPGMGIIESGSQGNAHYLGCKVVPGPKPEGATEERLLSTSWDAMQTVDVRKGPLVEHCVISDAGDDSWSVQSSDYLVVKASPRQLTILSRDPDTSGLLAGDRIRLSLDSPEAAILSSSGVSLAAAGLDPAVLEKLKTAGQWTLWGVSKKCSVLTLDRDFPAAPGTSIYSPDRQCAGFIFRDNQLHSSGRVLIKAGDGLIEHNVLDPSHGLVVNPELPVEAAAGIRNLTIRNNVIRGTGYYCPGPFLSQAGAISITAAGKAGHLRATGVFEDIVIENNRIEGVNGPNLVISSARNVTVRGNRFIDAQQTPPNDTGRNFGVPNNCVIYVTQSSGVHLEYNKFIHPGPYAVQTVIIDPSVK